MNNSLYHYIDPGFNHLQAGNYKLLILISDRSYSLAVMQREKLMVWRKTAQLAEFTQPGDIQELLNFSYNEIIVGISASCFILIPQSLFYPHHVKDIARYLSVQPSDTIFAQALDAYNQVIFKAGEMLSTAVSKFNFNNTVFGSSGWIQAIEANQPLEHELYIDLSAERFEIAYFNEGKLHLLNTFEFTHEDELAYYTVFVCQQLKLDLATTSIILSGDIAADNTRHYHLLKGIFMDVKLNTLTVAALANHLPKHQLLALTALSLCASLADA